MNERIVCQSCAMPMKKEEDFGTNQDLSKSEEYCCFCLKEGKFLDEGISMEGKIDKLVEISVNQLGMSKEQAKDMAKKTIPKLKRWREKYE